MADPVVTSHNAFAPRVHEGTTVDITIDGKTITVGAGEFLIAAAERAGTFIPRFCYHPRMKPVGMCRMCLVEVSGPRGATLQPACYVSVAPGMEVVTNSDKVKKAQDGVLEMLLVNHPLDCPVCDKGGECPLQDQVLAYGPGESRFLEEKRHWAKPTPISELVLLDRERCIQCGRCVRFANEIAGEAQIDFLGRGDAVEVNVFEDHAFSSYFSGNTVQICPVGALTATPYRFTARPWDLDQVESTCTLCSFGCRVAVQSSANRITRLLGIDSDPVNQSWLCDKGRFAAEASNADSRLTEPMIRRNGKLEPASWGEALALVAEKLTAARSGDGGADKIGVIGGARLSNEDAYAWAKLAKGILGTDSVDAQIGDGLPAEVVVSLPRATIDEACAAKCLVVLAGDLREELPVLFLRIRGAVVDAEVPLIELASEAGSLTALASASLAYRPGEAADLVRALTAKAGAERPTTVDEAGWTAAAEALGRAGSDGAGVVVILGRPSLAEDGALVAEAAAAMAEAWPAAKFLPALRRGNVMGAIDMGLAPGLLPGRVSLDDGRDWYGATWGTLPAARGRDTAGILEGLADGTMSTLVLVGADPLRDFPDARLAAEAVEKAGFVVAVDGFISATAARADVLLPAAIVHERSGTTTNIEGRVSRLGQKLVAPGQCWPDWMIASELAERLGGELGVESISDIWDEIEKLAPSHAGVTRAALDAPSARDGIIAPLAASPVTLSRRLSPEPFDPMATPGIESVELQGAPPRSGGAEPTGGESDVSNGSHGTNGARSSRPRPLTWPQALSPATLPTADSYSVRLVSRRRLYDGGVLLGACEAMTPLVAVAEVRVNPHDLEKLGVADGGPVRIKSGRGDVVLSAVVDGSVTRGVVAIDFNLDGPSGNGGTGAGDTASGSVAARLIDSRQAVVDVRMETP